MKKIACMFACLLMALAMMPGMALAAEGPTIRDIEDAPEFNLSDPEAIYPVDVIYHPENIEIRKVYELPTNADPSKLPHDSFERENILYECSDILREVIIGEETKTQTETETVESKKNDMETILGLFPESKDIVTEDGFIGTLLLRPSTIKAEVSGYGSSSSEVTITRSYPNLSDADTQYIPKTVDEGGKTYTLSDVQWQSDNTHNIDDYEITNRYTANAVYSGTKTSSYVKGYTITADYVGELCRTGVSKIRYTVIYNGSLIPAPEPEPEPTPEPSPETVPEPEPAPDYTWAFIVFPVLAALAALIIYMLRRNKRKELTHNAEIHEYDYADAYIGDDSDTDDGASDSDGER